jgi:hypothetical protein
MICLDRSSSSTCSSPKASLLHQGSANFPNANELTGLCIVHEAMIGINPLHLPFVSADVRQDSHAFEMRAMCTFVPKTVFATRPELLLQHGKIHH